MKIEIKVIGSGNDDDRDGWATIEVHAGDVKIADGHIGGEPEDNRIYRDYSWVVPMLETLAKKCGAEVEIVELSEVS
mgnify:CR=1 FL=1